jgi:hypothetical protein
MEQRPHLRRHDRVSEAVPGGNRIVIGVQQFAQPGMITGCDERTILERFHEHAKRF